MIASIIIHNTDCCSNLKNNAIFVDAALSVALLTIALLGTFGIIPMPGSVSNALLGTGGFYLASVLTAVAMGIKKNNNC